MTFALKSPMIKIIKDEDKNLNYSFILKCLARISAAALITIGILATVTAQAATATTATMLLAGAGLVGATFLPIFIPIAAILLIGGLCFFPLLCCSGGSFGGSQACDLNHSANPGCLNLTDRTLYHHNHNRYSSFHPATSAAVHVNPHVHHPIHASHRTFHGHGDSGHHSGPGFTVSTHHGHGHR